MGTKVVLFKDKIKRKLETNKARAQTALDLAIMGDTSRFVPFDTGMLDKSPTLSSKIGHGPSSLQYSLC